MRKTGCVLLWLGVVLTAVSFSGQEEVVSHWAFDGKTTEAVLDKASGSADPISGNFRTVTGVVGEAVKFDGYTTQVTRKAEDAPTLDSGFTLEAWVALAAETL